MTAFMPDAHTLLTVEQTVVGGRPAPKAACRAGACANTPSVTCIAPQRETEEFTPSANQPDCADVPGLSVTWSETSVLGVYHVSTNNYVQKVCSGFAWIVTNRLWLCQAASDILKLLLIPSSLSNA